MGDVFESTGCEHGYRERGWCSKCDAKEQPMADSERARLRTLHTELEALLGCCSDGECAVYEALNEAYNDGYIVGERAGMRRQRLAEPKEPTT
jgi:hypothetical protein